MTIIKPKYFVVVGKGDFPFDMLRYDQCYPVRSDDAAQLMSDSASEEHHRKLRYILMCTRAPSAPTRGRWSSFLWACTDEYPSESAAWMEHGDHGV